MSSIVSKPFKEIQKIYRTIFKGHPNLITSEDVNRQFMVSKKDIESLASSIGFCSTDYTFANNSATYVVFKGIVFDFKRNLIAPSIPTNNGTYYLCLYCKKNLVTFETDPTHEISGAKFVDGTELPAADVEVYDPTDVEVLWTTRPTPTGIWEYPQRNGRDFICPICYVKNTSGISIKNVLGKSKGNSMYVDLIDRLDDVIATADRNKTALTNDITSLSNSLNLDIKNLSDSLKTHNEIKVYTIKKDRMTFLQYQYPNTVDLTSLLNSSTEIKIVHIKNVGIILSGFISINHPSIIPAPDKGNTDLILHVPELASYTITTQEIEANTRYSENSSTIDGRTTYRVSMSGVDSTIVIKYLKASSWIYNNIIALI